MAQLLLYCHTHALHSSSSPRPMPWLNIDLQRPPKRVIKLHCSRYSLNTVLPSMLADSLSLHSYHYISLILVFLFKIEESKNQTENAEKELETDETAHSLPILNVVLKGV